jgi:HEPN domain-containing protein
MPTRAELQDISRLRLREAETLYEAGLYDGGAYLCGYILESALKACICRTLDMPEYLDAHRTLGKTFKTHDFDDLLTLAGIKAQLQANRNGPLWSNWNIATAWKPERRYEPPGRYLEADALALLNSIRDNPDGVLTWLSQRW